MVCFFANLRNRKKRDSGGGLKNLEDKSVFFCLSPYTKLLFGKTGGKLVLDCVSLKVLIPINWLINPRIFM